MVLTLIPVYQAGAVWPWAEFFLFQKTLGRPEDLSSWADPPRGRTDSWLPEAFVSLEQL